MKTNKVVIDIPKNIEALEEVLEVLKDRTWTEEARNEWVENRHATSVWYCEKYGSYMSGDKVIYNVKHEYTTYEQVTAQ